jgi:hypothetical protein
MPAPRRWFEELSYEIAVWTASGHIEEVLARCGNQVAVAAYQDGTSRRDAIDHARSRPAQPCHCC